MLLETGIVRVCAACEKEFGPLPEQPGTRKGHGLCKRHAIASYKEAGLADMIPALEQKPADHFAPDLAARLESQEDRACMTCARERGTMYDRSYGQCKRHWLEWAKQQGFTDEQIAEIAATVEAGQGWAPDLSQIS